MKNRTDKFWERVDKRGPDECWDWLAGLDKDNYGVMSGGSRKAKKLKAHRVSWEIHFGQIPFHDSHHGMCVLHRCDNPPCVNPAHLFLGTNHDNVLDMFKKGRARPGWVPGEKNGNAKITENKVKLIRRFGALKGKASWSNRVIGKMFGLSKAQTSKIISGKAWSIEPPMMEE